VRILLDEPLPRPLGRSLIGHDVSTVAGEGWTSLTNGALLRQAAERFDELLAADPDRRGPPWRWTAWRTGGCRTRDGRPEVKRSARLQHQRQFGCVLKRKGAAHSLGTNPATSATEAVPRYAEVANTLARRSAAT
jgi:hypothetical protein